MSKRLTVALVFGGLIPAILFFGCATGQKMVKPVSDNPGDLVSVFERDVAAARTNQVNLLAPTWFEKAEASLSAAQRGLKEQAEIADIARNVANGQAQLTKAQEMAAVSRTSLSDVINRRDMARKAGATGLEGYQRTEDDFLRLTREIERNNLGYALKNKDRVKEAYRSLEITAIKRNVLGEVRVTLKEAERLEAKKYAPNAYAEAVKKLNATDVFISQNPYETEEMNRRAKEALFYARRAVELSVQSKKIQSMDSEQVALWIEGIMQRITSQLTAPDMRDQKFDIQLENITGSIKAMQENLKFMDAKVQEQNNEIDLLTNKVTILEGKSREEQIAVQRLEAEKRFNEKFQEIQSYFGSNEAEIYRQGNQLVIRLRGMQFPVGKAVIMPDNYTLLSKVQQAIRSFDQPDVIIEGHTDSTGSTDVNEQLSQERATAVREYLIANNTLPGNKILAIGYGSARPLMSNETAEGRAVNRRIDVVITPQAR